MTEGNTGQTFLKSPPGTALCYPRMGQQWVRNFLRPHKTAQTHKVPWKTNGFPGNLELVG